MAALAYPFWFVVFPLIYMTPDKRNNAFLHFHSFQAAALGLIGVFGLTVLRTILGFFVRWFILFDVLLYPAMRMAEYAVFGLMIFGAVQAWRGAYADIPYLSDFVRALRGSSDESGASSADS